MVGPVYEEKNHMYKIVVDYNPSEVINNKIRERVFSTHAHLIGEKDKSFSVLLKNTVGEVLGGIQAALDKCSLSDLLVSALPAFF